MVAAALTLRRGWLALSGKNSKNVPSRPLGAYKPPIFGADKIPMPRFEILGEGQFRWHAHERVFGAILIAIGAALASFGVTTLGSEQATAVFFVTVLCLLVKLCGLYYWVRRVDMEVGPAGLSWRRRTIFGTKNLRMPGVQVVGVRLRLEARGDNFDASMSYRGLYFLYLVDLILEPEGLASTLRVVAKRRELPARRRAKEIAAGLDVPFFDAIGDASLNLAPHGASSGLVPAKITVAEEGGERVVRLRGLMPWKSLGVLSYAWLINLGIYFLVQGWLTEDLPGFAGTTALFMLSMQGMLTLWLMAGIFGSTRLGVGHGELSIKKSFSGLPLQTRQVPQAEIENLRVQTFHPLRHGLAIVLPGETILVARRRKALGLWGLRAWLIAELAPSGVSLSAEGSAPAPESSASASV